MIDADTNTDTRLTDTSTTGADTMAAKTNAKTNKPRFRTGQLILGLTLVAIGVAAFLSSAIGAPIGTTLAAVVLVEAGVVFWLIRRNRKLLNAMIATAATPEATLTGEAAGPDPELVKAAMAELDEIDSPSDPRLP